MFYIFKVENSNLYYIEENSNVTRIQEMLSRYSHDTITKIACFNIIPNYDTHESNSNINVLPNSNFLTYFNHHFQDCKYKLYWYYFDDLKIKEVLQYCKNLNKTNITNIKKNIIPKTLPDELKCNKCFLIFRSLNYLNKHQLNCNGLRCEKCDTLFSNKTSLKRHQINCGSFQCDKCGFKINSKFRFLKHLEKCYPE